MKRRSFRRPEEAFSEAVELLRTGGSIDAFLKEHPEQASELAPLLDTVASVRAERAVPARPPEVAAASRERFMAAAQRTVVSPSRKPLGFSAGIAAGWSALFGSFTRTSQSLLRDGGALGRRAAVRPLNHARYHSRSIGLPGEPLYQVKLASEQVQLLLARDESARQVVEQAIANRRIQEAQTITQLRRPVTSMTIGGHA